MADSNTHIRVADQDRIAIVARDWRPGLLLIIGNELTLSMTHAQARDVALAITNHLVAANPVNAVAEVRQTDEGVA